VAKNRLLSLAVVVAAVRVRPSATRKVDQVAGSPQPQRVARKACKQVACRVPLREVVAKEQRRRAVAVEAVAMVLLVLAV
jgi:hypothetical protein